MVAGVFATLLLAGPRPAVAQEIAGRAVDAATGAPVIYPEVALFDEDGVLVATTIGDSFGNFTVRAPAPGNYYCVTYRLGYQELRSPLLAVAAEARYAVDFTLHPDPIGLEGLEVTVDNETTLNWLHREFLGSPYAMKGFRMIRGRRLEEAQEKSRDNTEMLRWLYIPVSHGREVCVLIVVQGCGQLYVNGRWMPNEHIESVEMDSIVAVVTVLESPRVFLFTSSFDWKTHWNTGG